MTDKNTLAQTIQPYLEKALEATSNMADKAVDMVTQQVPILVEEMLRWYFTYTLIMFVFGLLLVLVALVVFVKIHKAIQKNRWSEELYVPLALGCAVTAGAGFTLLNLEWLKIWIAPRLWLIEYTASLVKGG